MPAILAESQASKGPKKRGKPFQLGHLSGKGAGTATRAGAIVLRACRVVNDFCGGNLSVGISAWVQAGENGLARDNAVRAQRRTPCPCPWREMMSARSAAEGVPPTTQLEGCHRPKVGFVHPTSNARHIQVASAGWNCRPHRTEVTPLVTPTPPWPAAQATRFSAYLYERAPVCKVRPTSSINRIGCRLISGLAVQAKPAGPDGFRREWPYLFDVLAGTSKQLGLHSRGLTCLAITLTLPSQPVDGFLPC
jgi:hypothetical protein